MYWSRVSQRWERIAFVCRYGHQDVYRVTGRDPLRNPLTTIEWALFDRHVERQVEAERRPLEEIGLPPPNE